MSMFTRFANRLWPRRLQRDLEDEVEFHIGMRTTEYLQNGRSPEDAASAAREQFGDVDAVLAQMRKARLTSTAMVITMTGIFMTVVMLWMAQQRLRYRDLTLPPVRALPIYNNPDHLTGSPPPPRPGPGPTWTQFVKQTKAFEALQKGPGTYSPGRVIDDEGRLMHEKAKSR